MDHSVNIEQNSKLEEQHLNVDIEAYKTAEQIFIETPSTEEIPSMEAGYWEGKLNKPEQDSYEYKEYIPEMVKQHGDQIENLDSYEEIDTSTIISEKDLGDGEICCIGL